MLLFCLAIMSHTGYGQEKSGFALLELYTSEGCSSCPAAEALMPELEQKYGEKLYILEFHVDYWDRLGWKDRFASGAYSARQQWYSGYFGANTVYTPQAVVNGKAHTTGSNKAKVTSLILQELTKTEQGRNIGFTVAEKGQAVTIEYTVKLQTDETLNFALVQDKATIKVGKGENAGRTLTHHNIVREFETVTGNTGRVQMQVPSGPDVGDWHIVAFIQNKKSGHIKVATRTIRV